MSSDGQETASQASLHSQASDSSHTCELCKKSVGVKSVAIKCMDCLVSYHLSCVVNKFTSVQGTPLKNSVQWLYDFLHDGNFRYVCETCKRNISDLGNSKTISATLQHNQDKLNDIYALKSSVESLAENVTVLSKQLLELKQNKEIFAGTNAIDSASATDPMHKLCSNNSPKDIIQVVQNAVAEGFKAKKNDDSVERSVIIYGLPESKNDIGKVRKLLQDDVNSIVYARRLGKSSAASTPPSAQSGSSTSCRPLKVELCSNDDRDWILHNASRLIASYRSSKVHIAKYLSSSELEHVKQLRTECTRLNKASTSNPPSGKARYIVIGTRIMQRLDSGKLAPITNSDSSKSTTSLPPKNA